MCFGLYLEFLSQQQVTPRILESLVYWLNPFPISCEVVFALIEMIPNLQPRVWFYEILLRHLCAKPLLACS